MSKTNLINQNKLSLMKAITGEIEKRGLRQREVAELLDIKQPRVSDLINEKTDKFSLDILVHYMAILGNNIEINYDADARNHLKVKIVKSR